MSGLGFDIETHVFHDLVRIPYDHFVMIARNAKKEANLYGPPDHDAATRPRASEIRRALARTLCANDRGSQAVDPRIQIEFAVDPIVIFPHPFRARRLTIMRGSNNPV